MGVMEEYFPRPKEYHPERWLRDERAMLQTTHSKDAAFISLPFSAGMRACPGKRFAEQALCLAVVNVSIFSDFYILNRLFDYILYQSHPQPHLWSIFNIRINGHLSNLSLLKGLNLTITEYRRSSSFWIAVYVES